MRTLMRGGTWAVLVLLTASAGVHAEGPTAHNPKFDDRDYWPEDVKRTAYYRQQWEPARVLVWLRIGEGSYSRFGADLNDLVDFSHFRVSRLSGNHDSGLNFLQLDLFRESCIKS